MSKHKLSKKLKDDIRYFAKDNDALRVSRNLRKVFFDYLRYQKEGLDVNFDLVIDDVEAAINLVELFADETKSRHT